MLHVRQTGQGTPVLLLHAFPLSSRMWHPQFDGLRAKAQLIAPDFPGFGLSPASPLAHSLDDFAKETLAVLEQLRVRDVVVVGLSMGGYVAFRLVELLGARLRGLLLADTRPTADSPEAVSQRHELACEVESQGVEIVAGEFLPKLLAPTSMRSQPELINRVRSLILENTSAGIATALRAMASRPDSTPMLPRINCPVVCVVGSEDSITPPEVSRAMVERLPSAHLVIIPEAGHLSNLEAPVAFNDALEELLTRVEQS